jgi:hypothetical protein
MKRRRFVTLMALSGAALVAAPLSRAAAAVGSGARGAAVRRRAPSAAVRREISNQEKALAGQLKTIRGYPLPPGSPMAFVWKPLRARRGR